MPLNPIEPRRLYREVADQLRRLIDTGEFAPGSRLPSERELAATLGISRPTVREALIALEVDGRVRIRVGSGIYVLAPTQSSPTPSSPAPSPPHAGPFEILAARALFEGVIAEAAACSAQACHLVTIDEALDAMRSAGTGANCIAADRAFHLAVAAVLANDAVTRVVAELFDQRINPYFARLASHFETPASWQAALAEHVAIRDCLASGEGVAARVAMRRHLERSQERFSSTFGEGYPLAVTVPPPVAQSARPAASSQSRPRSIAANTRRK